MSDGAALDFEVHQEEDDVASGSVVRVAVVGAGTGFLGVLCAGALLAASTGSWTPGAAPPREVHAIRPPVPRIEETPIRDTRRGLALRERQRRELERWGWVDRSAGVATIPIETAMGLVVEESR